MKPKLETARLKSLLGFLKPYRGKLAMGLVAAAIAGAIPGGVAAAVKEFADRSGSGNISGIYLVAGAIVGLYTVLVLLRYIQGTVLAEVSLRVGNDLRRTLYSHLLRMPLTYFDTQRTGNLMSTMTTDVAKLQNAANWVKDSIALPITAVTMSVILIRTSPKLVLITIAVVPLMALAIQQITRRLRALSQTAQGKQAELNALMDETLSSPRVIKAFAAEERELNRFAKVADGAIHAQMRGIRRSALLGPSVDWIGSIAMAVILVIGAQEIALHTSDLLRVTKEATAAGLVGAARDSWVADRVRGLSIGGFLQFVFAANELSRAIGGMGSLRGALLDMFGAVDRIHEEVLDVHPEIADLPDAIDLGDVKGALSLEDVTYGYMLETPVLCGVTLEIQPGETIAFVGATGSGKSTLVDLIPRFIDPWSGCVKLDGIDLRNIKQGSLRSVMAIVPQKTVLFAGTIFENIAYGKPGATHDDVELAARAAGAHEFIMSKLDGYSTL
ncbi:MAG: ABC transporter ATP-binding protein, partial [Armatimonadaceae bacterium]